MDQPAPQPKPKRERGYYATRWKRAKEAFHRITAISTKQNKALLGLEQAPSTSLTKAIAALDPLVAADTEVRRLETAVATYDQAMRAYAAMLAKAEDIQPPAFIQKGVYLAAIKTLLKELKAVRLELNKDVAYARAKTMQAGSAGRRRAVIEVELQRGAAAFVTAKNRIARLKLDRTQEFANFNAEVKATALGLKGLVAQLNRVLAAQQFRGLVVPGHITQTLDQYAAAGVSAERYPNFDHAKRVAALRELEAALASFRAWFKDTEAVARRN
ncbi:MAG: hypothetical protein IT317_05490 [Anaerolineales bacterium]|nr:hypothetical protein [Anaerolineales bacterium]